MAAPRKINKIIISTMPRSGTVFFFNFIAQLFKFNKVEPKFTGGFQPPPPEWDPYKFDETYLELNDGEILCAHYPLNAKLTTLFNRDDVLAIYLYRDPRDAAISAMMYIKYALTHHPLHPLFATLSESEALALMLSGGIVKVDGELGPDYITHEGMRYFCDWAHAWIRDPRVVSIKYEDLTTDLERTVVNALGKANVGIDHLSIQEVATQFKFGKLSGGREQGVEDKYSHFRKGIIGDYRTHFTEFHKAICKACIGADLIHFQYEKDLLW